MEVEKPNKSVAWEDVNTREFSNFVLNESLYPSHLAMPRHHHKLAHISIVLGGSYTENYGRRSRTAQPSLLVFHPPGEEHSVNFHNLGARVFSLHIKHDWLEHIRDYSRILDAPAHFYGGTAASLAARMHDESSCMNVVAGLTIEALALEIFAETTKQALLTEKKIPRWLRQAEEILRARFTEAVSVTEIAETVGVHPIYLAREFRRFFHCTAGDYVRRLRIEAACCEIIKPDASIAEVALKMGFYDQSHFTNLFKRAIGMTPAQYKKSFPNL